MYSRIAGMREWVTEERKTWQLGHAGFGSTKEKEIIVASLVMFGPLRP